MHIHAFALPSNRNVAKGTNTVEQVARIEEWTNVRSFSTGCTLTRNQLNPHFPTTDEHWEVDDGWCALCVLWRYIFISKNCLKITRFADWSSFAIITHSLFIGALDVQWCPTIPLWRDQGWLRSDLCISRSEHVSARAMNAIAPFRHSQTFHNFLFLFLLFQLNWPKPHIPFLFVLRV